MAIATRKAEQTKSNHNRGIHYRANESSVAKCIQTPAAGLPTLCNPRTNRKGSQPSGYISCISKFPDRSSALGTSCLTQHIHTQPGSLLPKFRKVDQVIHAVVQ
jgi:hypothetical protein